MALIPHTCEYCSGSFLKEKGAINRAKQLGLSLYCNRTCAGMARRSQKTKEERVRDKKEYDIKYREKNLSIILSRKKLYHKKTYDKEKAALVRKSRMSKHVEYCRTPEYKEYKKQYDQIYRAKKEGGEFWESLIIINKIQKEYDDKMARFQNGLHNKTQKRKRAWKAATKNSQQQI